jgi:hypothetical protein
MAEICRFYGMVIQMFGNDHNPPHLHIFYNDYKEVIKLVNGKIMKGDLPSGQLNFIKLCNVLHKEELLDNFNYLRAEIKTFKKIEPLNKFFK